MKYVTDCAAPRPVELEATFVTLYLFGLATSVTSYPFELATFVTLYIPCL